MQSLQLGKTLVALEELLESSDSAEVYKLQLESCSSLITHLAAVVDKLERRQHD